MKRAVLLCALTLSLSPSLSLARVAQSDSQFWSEADVTIPLESGWSITAVSVVRQGNALPNPSLWGGGATFDWSDGPWTYTGGYYSVQVRNSATGSWLNVNLPLAAISYALRIGDVSLSDRSRFEKLMGAPGDPWRYRNRMLARLPLVFLPWLSLFGSDEAFYDFTRHYWSRNRAQAGISIAVSQKAAADFYYLRQDDHFSRPSALNVLGFAVRLEL